MIYHKAYSCQDIPSQWQAASSFSPPYSNGKNIQKRIIWLNQAVAYKYILLAGTPSTCSVSLESKSISI